MRAVGKDAYLSTHIHSLSAFTHSHILPVVPGSHLAQIFPSLFYFDCHCPQSSLDPISSELLE
jgi:hypothetical protein